MLYLHTQSLSIAVDGDKLTSSMLLMLLGILLASMYIIFIKKFRGEFVLALIEAGAFGEETAKSLSELEIKDSFLRRFFVNTKFAFSPDYFSISASDVEEAEKGMKYYVNEDDIEKLNAKYGNSGITFIQLLITIIAFFSVALVLVTAIPQILNMFA